MTRLFRAGSGTNALERQVLVVLADADEVVVAGVRERELGTTCTVELAMKIDRSAFLRQHEHMNRRREYSRVEDAVPAGVGSDASEIVLELRSEVLAVATSEAQVRAVALPVGVRADVDVSGVASSELVSGPGLYNNHSSTPEGLRYSNGSTYSVDRTDGGTVSSLRNGSSEENESGLELHS